MQDRSTPPRHRTCFAVAAYGSTDQVRGEVDAPQRKPDIPQRPDARLACNCGQSPVAVWKGAMEYDAASRSINRFQPCRLLVKRPQKILWHASCNEMRDLKVRIGRSTGY